MSFPSPDFSGIKHVPLEEMDPNSDTKEETSAAKDFSAFDQDYSSFEHNLSSFDLTNIHKTFKSLNSVYENMSTEKLVPNVAKQHQVSNVNPSADDPSPNTDNDIKIGTEEERKYVSDPPVSATDQEAGQNPLLLGISPSTEAGAPSTSTNSPAALTTSAIDSQTTSPSPATGLTLVNLPFDHELHGYEASLGKLAEKVLARKGTRDKIVYVAMWAINAAFAAIIGVRAIGGNKVSKKTEQKISIGVSCAIAAIWSISAIFALCNFSSRGNNTTYREKSIEYFRIFGSKQIRTGIFTASTLVLGVLNPSLALFIVVVAVICGEIVLALIFWKCKKYDQHVRHIADRYISLTGFKAQHVFKQTEDADTRQYVIDTGEQEVVRLCEELYGHCNSIDDYCKKVDLKDFHDALQNQDNHYAALARFVESKSDVYILLSYPLRKALEDNKKGRYAGKYNNVIGKRKPTPLDDIRNSYALVPNKET